MNLTFDIKSLQASADHSRDSANHSEMYLDPETKAPGLWLVGDQGVYFMSNGMGDDRPPVVYANECNPETDPDGWYDVKRESFGADDGSIFVPLASVDEWLRSGRRVVTVKLTENAVEFLC